MAGQMLTSALEKFIRSLCLESYPCGRRKAYLRKCEDLDDESEEDALVELLRSPMSPWQEEGSWSPQALALREMAVKTPDILKSEFIYSFFTTLRIVDKRVCVIDKGLLKFSRLEELVLSANNITEFPSENLPKTLRVLELYCNQISSLSSLNTHPPPPHLQHLGLGNNCLGSLDIMQYFTADFWPQLISLDLSWSEFTELCALMEAFSKLPRLQSLVLEGNPLTLSPSYPGFVLDSLHRLLYLDGSRVMPDDRHRFRGLAQHTVCDEAEVIVCVQKIRGVPCPALPVDEFPVVSYSYSVSYEFLDQPSQEKTDVESHISASIIRNSQDQEVVSCQPTDLLKTSKEDQIKDYCVVMNNTPKQEWAEVLELNYTRTHRINDLAALKSFLLRGLWVSVEEEKVLSWPAPPAEDPGIKSLADKKGKENTDMGQRRREEKKKKKEPVLNLIPEAPVRQTLGTIHVELQDLLKGKDQIQVKCDLGVLLSQQTTMAHEKEQEKKPKEDKKDDRKAKPREDSTKAQRNLPSSKGKSKGRKESDMYAPAEESIRSNMEPLTVEFSVQLGKLSSVSQFSSLKAVN